MRERWYDGLFIGKGEAADECLILLTDGKVVRSRSVAPKPEGIKVTKDMLNAVTRGSQQVSCLMRGDRQQSAARTQ